MTNTFSTLVYPSDLTTIDNFFPEAIKFEFYQREGVNFDVAIDYLKNNHDATMEATEASTPDKKTIEETSSDAEDKSNQDTGKGLEESKKEDLKQQLVNKSRAYLKQASAAFKYIQTANATKHEVGNIYLHMPNNISLSEEAGWGAQGLGAVGMLTKSALKKGDASSVSSIGLGAAAGHAGNLLAAGAAGIAGAVLSKIPGVNAMSAGILGMIGGEVIQQGGEAAFSVAHNPYMEMMFSGVGFRSFKFDFIFRARNKTEIKTVGHIIKMFRQHSRPTWVKKGLGKSFMNYPQEFKIKFLTLTDPDTTVEQYVDNKHLPTLKPCVCSNVETNFTPDNIWAAYEEGAPVAITLGLTFQETELVMAGDVAAEWPDAEEQEGQNPVGKQSDEAVPASLNLAKRNF